MKKICQLFISTTKYYIPKFTYITTPPRKNFSKRNNSAHLFEKTEDVEDIFYYLHRIKELITNKYDKQAEALVTEMVSNNLYIPGGIYVAFIEHYLKTRNVKQALEWLNKMENAENADKMFDRYTGIWSVLVKYNQLDKALLLFNKFMESKQIKNEKIFSIMIGGCMKKNRVDEALKIWKMMKNANIKPNQYMYSAFLKGVKELPDDLEPFLQQLEADGAVMDLVNYTQIVKALLKKCRFDDAWKTLERMKKENITPDARIYTILCDAYTRINDIEKALQVLELAKRELRVIDDGMYNIIIRAYFLANLPNEAKQVYKLMLKDNVKPTRYTYCVLFDGLFAVGLFDEAMEHYRTMKKEQIYPTVTSYGKAIVNLCRKDRVEELKHILTDMKSLNVDLPPFALPYLDLVELPF